MPSLYKFSCEVFGQTLIGERFKHRGVQNNLVLNEFHFPTDKMKESLRGFASKYHCFWFWIFQIIPAVNLYRLFYDTSTKGYQITRKM